MSWHSVRGHEQVFEGLRGLLASRRLPHALLFVGPSGIGKRTFARTFAKALLCDRNPGDTLDACGSCAGCLQVEAKTHPDLLEVQRPEDRQELPIRLIRQLRDEFGLKPARGRRRIAIVDDAEDFNDEAANALLKTLEEPPPGSVLILIATSAETVLPTLVSRCHVIRFSPLPVEPLAEVLTERGLAPDAESARRLASLAEGSVARAIDLGDPELERFRRQLIDEVSAPAGFDPSVVAERVAGYLAQAAKDHPTKRRHAGLLVGELARLFRGTLWTTAGLESPSPDPRERQAAAALAQRLEPEDVFLLADRCLLAEHQLHRNVYLPLVFESLFHDLGRTLNRRVHP